MKKADVKLKEANGVSHGQLRRELTLGTLVQLAAILLTLAAGWGNLQKELGLIRHDLDQLLRSNGQLRQQLERLSEHDLQQEYRLRAVEEQLELPKVERQVELPKVKEQSGPKAG